MRGARTGPRNSPTGFNAAFLSAQFWDGRAPTLEEQAKGPIQAHVEMDLTPEEAVQRLRDTGYEPYFEAAFPGEDYSVQLQAVGGRGTHTWSLTDAGTAAWLSITAEGVLSGTPTGSGATTVTVAVADESGQEATRALSMVVLESLAVVETSLPTATQGRPYGAQLVATGGDGAYTWSLGGGTLPTGVALAGGGALVGTPEEGGRSPSPPASPMTPTVRRRRPSTSRSSGRPPSRPAPSRRASRACRTALSWRPRAGRGHTAGP